MNKKQRSLLAAQLRQFCELKRSGVRSETALRIAVADNSVTRKPNVDSLQAASLVGILPDKLPRLRSLLSGSDEERTLALACAAANVLDEPSQRSGAWSSLYASIAVTGVVVIFFSLSVAPAFKDVFDSFGGELPSITLLALFLAQWVFGPLGAVLLVLVMAKAIWTVRPQWMGGLTQRIDALMKNLPKFGYATRVTHTRLLAEWLAAGGAGGDILERLNCLIELSGSGLFGRLVTSLLQAMQEGQSLAQATATQPWLPGLAMVLLDAETDLKEGQFAVEKGLSAYAAGLDDRSDAIVASLTLTAQLIVGAIVGFFVVAMYLPIFKLGSVI
jgi:type IV pilus assembly protein PilC